VARTEARQVAEMIDIVKKDARGRGALIDDKGQPCALGALFQAAGEQRLGVPGVRPKLFRLFRRFPVLRYGCRVREVWVTNDTYIDVRSRRKALIALFKSWLPVGRWT